jgi:CPA2 family monovalent cation:H+ antiporter-2
VHNIDLILTLTGAFSAALVFGYLTQRLGLSAIVGYLVAGILVGPHTPGFVADQSMAEQLAEIGVVLLMFGVGLQFHVDELLAVRKVAVPGAIAQSSAATLLGALAAASLGWQFSAAVVFGAALSVASTVVLVRVLADHHDLHTPTGHIAVGWLVVEDVLTVLILVLLPVVFEESGDGSSLGVALALTAVKVAGLVWFTMTVGTRAIPALLNRIAATQSRELFTLAVLAIALGIAVGSAVLFGVSMALGAFLAGLVVGRSEFSLRAASDALPMRDAFAVLFFVSVGMLLDPAQIAASPGLLAMTLAVVLLGKPLVAAVVVLAMRYPVKVALAVAVALAQIGEFSFILTALGRSLGILDAAATNVIVATAIVSIVLNPPLYRLVGPIDRWLAARGWSGPRAATEEQGSTTVTRLDPAHRAVVVGYGPSGRTLTRLLQENGVAPTIVELNVETVRELRAQGVHAVYGDASRRDTLQAAGMAQSATLILSSAGMQSASETIQVAREINPKVHVFARTAYLRELPTLKAAGADTVFTGEGEVAFAMTEAILRRLGAIPEQIDRERRRVHDDLFGATG